MRPTRSLGSGRGVGSVGAKFLDALHKGERIGEKDDASRRWVFEVLGGTGLFKGAGQAFTATADYLRWSADERSDKLGESITDYVMPELDAVANNGQATYTMFADPHEHILGHSLAGLSVAPRGTITEEEVGEAKAIGSESDMHMWLAKHCDVQLNVELVVASPPERYADPVTLRRLEALFDDPSLTVRKNSARLVEYLGLAPFFMISARLVRWRRNLPKDAPFFPCSELPLARAGIAPQFLTETPSAVKQISLSLRPSGKWSVLGIHTGGLRFPTIEET
eukprot:CAMPEP_0174878730 /NCGR_PEP_ID=MMETSP1114-20130205/82906_1 /TAXON_ID=312471 /ORGANISM="Neobodo designis, Strain CCAP 1951/1" /LENGTH=279 /DNA_ID=CAMNT_0016114119 /DNA_START=126 /DNA_END=962 /DNA_ORIENTATION=+